MDRLSSITWLVLLAVLRSVLTSEPNPPSWPDSVSVFGPDDSTSTIQAAVNKAYSLNGGRPEIGQFSLHRFAFLFKPGSYSVDVPVGYYTQVLGLGDAPTDVVFTSSKGVYCEEASYTINPGALDTFWRSAENFHTKADFAWNENGHKGMIWAASQATGLRRIVVEGDLDLFEYRHGDPAAGFASGGFLSNSIVKGEVDSGSQQQFLARNCEVGSWVDGVWNIVSVGVKGAPKGHCGADASKCSHGYVTVDAAPAVVEKPYITIDKTGKFHLNIPNVTRDRIGVKFTSESKVGFESVYLAKAGTDTADSINAKLANGLHVVLAPGIYELSAPLKLNHKNQVLLGLGIATLVPVNGTPAVTVGNVDGVRVAGILLEAGAKPSESLIEWGRSDQKFAGNAGNPGSINDLYTRVAGPKSRTPAQARTMAQINSGNVIIDNTWFWRADHLEGGGLTKNGDNPVDVGIVVKGDDVIAYGLKAEHALTDQAQWYGDRGKVFMFQAEMPYDVTQANYGDKGYTGFRVASSVKEHDAYGVGVYHYFRDHEVTVKSAIVAPVALESSFVSPLAVFLNGNGIVQHILNDKGSETAQNPKAPTAAVPQWFCDGLLRFHGNITAQGCKVGDPVTCPGTSVGCKGNTCCPDGSTCPSAEEDFGCCPSGKKADCVKPGPSPPSPPSPPTPPSPPSPPPPVPPSPPSPPSPPMKHCNVGDPVFCPGTKTKCAGNACCPDLATCPSADNSFHGCPSPKQFDCTTASVSLVV